MIVTLGATFDSVPLVTDSGGQARFVIRCVRGLDDSPRVRGEDTVIPTAPGRVPRDRVWDGRTVELAGYVMGTGGDEGEQRADVRAALEELRTLFDPTRDPATLVIDLEDGGTATIEARPVNMLTAAEDATPTLREVSIELEAVEDEWVVVPAGS